MNALLIIISYSLSEQLAMPNIILLLLVSSLFIGACSSTKQSVTQVELKSSSQFAQTGDIQLIKGTKHWFVKGTLHALGNHVYSQKQIRIDFFDANGQVLKSVTTQLKNLSSRVGIHKRHTCSRVKFSTKIGAIAAYAKVSATLIPSTQ